MNSPNSYKAINKRDANSYSAGKTILPKWIILEMGLYILLDALSLWRRQKADLVYIELLNL